MKKIILSLLMFLPLLAKPQALEMINYEWAKNPVLHPLSAAESTEPVVYIVDDRVVEFIWSKDDALEEYVTRHRVIHLNDNKAVEDFNKVYVPVRSPSYLITFKARSIGKDGKVKEMLRGEMKEVTEKGTTYMSLAVDGLEKGSELEYIYTLKRNTSYIGSEFIQSGVLIRKSDAKFISPENIVLGCKSYNGFPAIKDTLIDKKRFYTASMENIQPSYEEKYAVREALLMRVEYKVNKNLRRGTGNLLTYADAGKTNYTRLTTYEKNEQKEVEKLASKLNLKSKSDEEKIRAVESYLKTNINMQKGVDVKDIAETIKTGIGGEFEMNKLSVALLKQAQVKFDIIITISRYDRDFDPDFESWNYLDDLMLYFPSLDKYMMPANYAYRFGLLPTQYLGSYALFIKEVGIGDITSSVTSVKKLPEPPMDISSDNMDITINFSKDMSTVNQHTHRAMAGYVGLGVRPFYFYSADDKKKEQLESLMKFDIDGARVTTAKAMNYNLNTKETDEPFIMDGDLSYSSLLEKADKTVLFKVGAVIGTQVEMYQDKPRQKPISVDFLHFEDRHITITIPDGYVAKGLDALKINITGGDGDKPTMGFISSYKLNGNKLEINIHEYYGKLTYPVAMYDQFRKVINASADFNKVTIVFEKKS